MKVTWTFLIALAAGWGMAAPAPGSAPATAPTPDDWRLVWSDEFEKDGPPDPQNWVCDTGFIRNHELQWYQPENARCVNGLLVIEARRERKPNPRYEPGHRDWRRNRQYAEYTSASLKTLGKHSWQYGRFEMRARIDTRPGLWPAFWTLGLGRRWPEGGEIDVMEFYRGMLLANVCWPAHDLPRNGHRPGHWQGHVWWDDSRRPINTFNDPNWSEKFHVWRLDWDERDIRIYVDDVLLKQVELKNTEDTEGQSPFRRPHFLLLNLAIGGDHGGDPSKTQFPAKFEVDYVRVHQKESWATTKPVEEGDERHERKHGRRRHP